MISIIGAGRVGSALGFLIAAASLDDLVLGITGVSVLIINYEIYKLI